MMKNILMLFVLMMFAECSYAGFKNGNTLAEWMVEYEKSDNDNSKDPFMVALYDGYVTGVADTLYDISWCSPGNITIGQVLKIVSKYLNNNPQNLHSSAYSLVEQALKEAFPCKK
jgi:hypothetical protein